MEWWRDAEVGEGRDGEMRAGRDGVVEGVVGWYVCGGELRALNFFIFSYV